MLEHIAVFVLAFIFLVKGADVFVEAIAKFAKKVGVSEFIIGLTVTSFGTTLPELASSISASFQNSSGLIIGNIVGSNIANIGLIIGISSIIHFIKTEKKMYERDGYILIVSVLAFAFFSYDGFITLGEGIVLLLIYIIYILFLMNTKGKHATRYKFHDFLAYMLDFKYIATIRSWLVKDALKTPATKRTATEKKVVGLFEESLLMDIVIAISSIVAIIFGAKYLVNESLLLANLFHVPEALIGLSIIAIGTSLPELTVAIVAARKGHGHLAIGNIFGANIANLLMTIGISSLIRPVQVSTNALMYTIPIMGFFSLALVYFIKHNKKIGKREGIIALVSYFAFMTFAFVKGLG
ncbi:MAG: calcium/sodium antiporter [archaeon]